VHKLGPVSAILPVCSEIVFCAPHTQASTLDACARKKARHDECARCGAGWRPASSSTLRTEVAETGMPRPLSSPTIRL
jgi:hypothetical protein